MTSDPVCTNNPWRYIEFFVGSAPHQGTLTTGDQKRDAVAAAKTRLAKDYVLIGVLEQFDDTLEMLEYMMPHFYKDARQVWHSDEIQSGRNQTKSLKKTPLSKEADMKMKTTVLKYEVDLYDFCRALFNEKLRYKRMSWFERHFGV